MSMEERLLDGARTITGDRGIHDVAEFHPRGFAAAAGAGAGLGSAAGDSATDSSLGGMIGGTGGAAAGMAGAAAARGLPMRIGMAVTPEKVYLLEIRGALDVEDVSMLATIEKADVDVDVHGRVVNQVVVLRDRASGKTFEMEAPRLSPLRAGKMVDALLEMASGSAEQTP